MVDWGLTVSSDNFLDFIEFVESLDGCQVVDVQPEYLVANLAEHGVVELEERQLHAFPILVQLFG